MKGVVISIGDYDFLIMPHYKCLLGHSWIWDGPYLRECERCGKSESYELRDTGRTKCWVWTNDFTITNPPTNER